MTYWVLWGVAVALYLAWPLTHLEAYHYTNDEGLYVQRAALANAGYPLYTETYINKPPLLVWTLQLAFRVTGQTLAVARLATLCLTLPGFVAVGVIARRLWGKWAGLMAAGVLLCLPEIPVRAHVVMANLPALSLALVAMGTALLFRHSGQRGWMALSGVAFTGALLIHPLLIYVALPLAMILFLPGPVVSANRPARRTGWVDMAVFLSVAAAAGVLTLAAVDRHAFFKWVFQSNYGAVSGLFLPQKNWEQIAGYLNNNLPLVGLSTISVVALSTVPGRRCGLLVVVVWWFATVAILKACSLLWDEHLVFLAYPLVIVTGGGLATAGRWVIEGCRTKQGLAWWRIALAMSLLAGAIFFAVDRWEATRPYLAVGPEWSPDHLATRAYIEAHVPPGGFVATDDPLLAFAAGRLVPPPLTEASRKQIWMGRLTTDDVIGSIFRYGVRAVLFSTYRLELLPGLEDWIAHVAVERRDFGELRTYRLDLPRSVSDTAIARLGDGIELHGYALSSDVLRPGDVLSVMLFWKCGRAVPVDYQVFVHLVDEEDHLWSQHDGPPSRGRHPTSQWVEDEQVFDMHSVEIGADVPPGKYRLITGMYGWPSLQRLPALRPDGSRWPDDRIVLTELHVTVP